MLRNYWWRNTLERAEFPTHPEAEGLALCIGDATRALADNVPWTDVTIATRVEPIDIFAGRIALDLTAIPL
jgi:hypothetical protein